MRHGQIEQLGQLFITSQVCFRHIFFNLLSILMMHVGWALMDDRGDLYSHTLTYSHIVGNVPRKLLLP
jgi:hypothetical protein